MGTEDTEKLPQRLTLTVGEAARLLGIGRGTAYEAARMGVIPTVRVGKRLLVPRTALLRMLDGEAGRKPEPAGVK